MSSHQTLSDLEIHLDARDVLRTMGAESDERADPKLRALVDEMLPDVMSAISPRAVFAVFPVEHMGDTELHLRGCPKINGPIAEFLKPAQRVAVFVGTVGEDLAEYVLERTRNGRDVRTATLEAIAQSASDAAIDAIADALYWQEAGPDEAVTPPFSPGCCGMPLAELKTLTSIVDTSAIGVQLLPTLGLDPAYSVSGLLGIGKSDAVREHGIPCQYCKPGTCKASTRRW